MKGLRGMPRSYSSWIRELKALPEGSTPTRPRSAPASPAITSARVNTFEMLCREKRSRKSPTPYR